MARVDRQSCLRRAAPVVLLIASLTARPAPAQTGFEPTPLHPSGDATGMISVWSAEPPPHLQWSAASAVDAAYGAVRTAVPEMQLPERNIVDWRADLRIVGLLGLFERYAVGFELPVLLLEKGLDTSFTQSVVGHQGFTSGHIGDFGFFGQGRVTQQLGTVPAIAVGLRLRFPSGSPAALAGEPGLIIEPVAVGTWSFGPHSVSINAAYRLRTVPMRLRTTRIGHDIVWGVAAKYALAVPPYSAPQALIGEITGTLPTFEHSGPGEHASLEARLALRQSSLIHGDSALSATFGLGVGIIRTPGSPLLRGFVNVGYASEHPYVDDDADGIPNRRDACRHAAEDVDDFEDGDGCPDDDNDGDGIDDIDDDCPDAAEDADDVDDWDGCPDLDLPDDDHDGMLGADDHCPEAAEDYDGFDDDDGCPDPDNDGDGLADINDVCPDAAEDRNGFEDDDGCPDAGRGARMFSLEGERVRLFRPLLFRGQSTELTWRSLRVLDQLAATLRSHPEIERLHVEVAARRRARRWLQLATARAESVYVELHKRGIASDRIRVAAARWSPARAGRIEITIQRSSAAKRNRGNRKRRRR